jgi:hypothetical protein
MCVNPRRSARLTGGRMRRILFDLAAGTTGDESSAAAPVWLPLS